MNIIIFGPPGAGKGTQSDKLIEKYDLTHIATGDLFRICLLYTSPSPRDTIRSRMPSSA